jgi:hypothetical protein
MTARRYTQKQRCYRQFMGNGQRQDQWQSPDLNLYYIT